MSEEEFATPEEDLALSPHYQTILTISLVMTVLSVLTSGYVVLNHLKNWNHPGRQRNALIIICMAPLYAVDCCAGLYELEEGEVVADILDMTKECYEALCLHAFLAWMYETAGLDDDVIKGKKPLPDSFKGRDLHLRFPANKIYGDHGHFSTEWLHKLKMLTTQFVVLRPLLSLVDLVFVDLYENRFSGKIGWIVKISLGLSASAAFQAILGFEHAFGPELASHRPMAKLIVVKGIVVFGAWQGLILKLLGHYGVLSDGVKFSKDEVELAWEDFLACLEMGLLFSPLGVYAFPPPQKPSVKEVEMKEKKSK